MASGRIGMLVKRLRERAGLSQAALARKAGVTREYISMLETGARTAPSVATLRRIAKALGVPVTALLE